MIEISLGKLAMFIFGLSLVQAYWADRHTKELKRQIHFCYEDLSEKIAGK
jgi:hypothetical protein